MGAVVDAAGDAVGSTVVGVAVVGPDVDGATVGFDAVGEMDGESDGEVDAMVGRSVGWVVAGAAVGLVGAEVAMPQLLFGEQWRHCAAG